MWARQVLAAHEAARGERRSGGGDNNKPDGLKFELEDDIFAQQKDRRRIEFAFLRSLRTLLPVYSTLAVCFLACHVAREAILPSDCLLYTFAREAILPSDMYRWAMEAKLPYLAVFTEVDRLLGSSLQLQGCPLDARQLFRPVRVIGAWQLEAAAGSIAQDYVSLQKICEERSNAGGSDPNANSPDFRMLDDSNSEEFGMRELLCAIAAAYDKINVAHGKSEWSLTLFLFDENPKEHLRSQSQGIEEMTSTNGVNKRYQDGTFVEASCISSSSGHDAMQILKAEMQDLGFHYMPPRKPRKSDGYLCYRRRRLGGGFIYVAHADYYMLLCAFAKFAEVNVRIMHTSVLKLERRLECIEDRIERSLNTLQNLSSQTRDELRPVSD
ncbi:TATA box-binding protein-associated factor RNA polymerase I subunit B [Dichanthelium oligosanthes]|uniref:TATA box-binding protein-associated factor RNA polymerase I subunit B n=1 Tax=Dichanthelium oligosanthes TaxID=888268 RepID=A0A1E5UW45_9POAL|nr:TATA box-binding protein-associated factor RNA polymerase I subunit B [Dichanthelium oligosanthes]